MPMPVSSSPLASSCDELGHLDFLAAEQSNAMCNQAELSWEKSTRIKDGLNNAHNHKICLPDISQDRPC